MTPATQTDAVAHASRAPASPVRQGVPQLLPEPWVVVSDVGVRLDVVPHGAAHGLLAWQVPVDDEDDLLARVRHVELEGGPVRGHEVLGEDDHGPARVVDGLRDLDRKGKRLKLRFTLRLFLFQYFAYLSLSFFPLFFFFFHFPLCFYFSSPVCLYYLNYSTVYGLVCFLFLSFTIQSDSIFSSSVCFY